MSDRRDYQRRWRAAHREEQRAYYRRYRREHPEHGAAYRQRHKDKVAARSQLNEAVRAGQMEREACEVCGDPETHAHHEDYRRPLDVRWLCPTHHYAEHYETYESETHDH